ESLRVKLFALADDSMGGRDTGSPGNMKAADWVAATFQRYGLEPAGDNGTWFQVIPFIRTAPDASLHLRTGAGELVPGADFVIILGRVHWVASGVHAIYAGVAGDSMNYPAADAATNMLVIFAAPPGVDFRAAGAALNGARRNPRFAAA